MASFEGDRRAVVVAGRVIGGAGKGSWVKTLFGEDANWGRIIAALGRFGAELDPERVDIAFDDVTMVKNGLGQGKEVEAKATEVLKRKQFAVKIDLHAGPPRPSTTPAISPSITSGLMMIIGLSCK